MDLTTIFYHVDEFCKHFEKEQEKILLSKGKGSRRRKSNLTLSEIMTISIWFHYSGYKTFKDYYTKCADLRPAFPRLVSYNRFIELKGEALIPLAVFAKLNAGKSTGVAFIDSSSLEACNVRRQSSNKVFRGIASKGKTSLGWFFGFKVHLVINHKGQIINFCMSTGSIADNNHKIVETITKNVSGKLFGDKGYLGQKLFEKLFYKGVKLFTKIRSNMKNKLMETEDKLLLKKRGVVESVIGILKEIFSLEHTRHRSFTNFLVHVSSVFAAYALRLRKPNIDFSSRTKFINALA